MYGGLLLHRLGVEAQPALSAVHYVALFALARATLAGAPGAAAAEGKGDTKRE